MPWTYDTYFFLKLKLWGQRNKDYFGFYSLVGRRKIFPIFIWPYIDLVPHIEVQNLFSLLFFSQKFVLFFSSRVSCFPSKVFFQRKKILIITEDDKEWLVLFLWEKKKTFWKITRNFHQKVNLSWAGDKISRASTEYNFIHQRRKKNLGILHSFIFFS